MCVLKREGRQQGKRERESGRAAEREMGRGKRVRDKKRMDRGERKSERSYRFRMRVEREGGCQILRRDKREWDREES